LSSLNTSAYLQSGGQLSPISFNFKNNKNNGNLA
jgi:hypothetical protein